MATVGTGIAPRQALEARNLRRGGCRHRGLAPRQAFGILRFLSAHPAKVRRCVLSPWFDAECRSFRRRARRHERQYRRTKLAADRSAWVHFVRDMHRSYREKERTYWETKIVSHAKDPKRLW